MNNYDFMVSYVKNERVNDCYCHLMKIANKLYNYSTEICSVDYENKTALLNTRKYSRTTTKIQSQLKSILERYGLTITEYIGEPCYYWNCGYQGAENWTRKDMKSRGFN